MDVHLLRFYLASGLRAHIILSMARIHAQYSGLRSSPSLFTCEAAPRPFIGGTAPSPFSPRPSACGAKGYPPMGEPLPHSFPLHQGWNPWGVEIRAVAFQGRGPPGPYPSVVTLGGVGERAPPLTLVLSPPSPLGRSGGESTYVVL